MNPSWVDDQQRRYTQNSVGSSTTSAARGRSRTRIIRVNLNGLECRETIEQNVKTINNLIQCGNYDNKDINQDNYECFDINKRKLVKGQWIDVKDTVDQWLEAQVLDVKDDSSAVYIHYNGWGARWNEWIPMNSPRIMPFRFHTRQITVTNYNSPFPNSISNQNINMVSPSTHVNVHNNSSSSSQNNQNTTSTTTNNNSTITHVNNSQNTNSNSESNNNNNVISSVNPNTQNTPTNPQISQDFQEIFKELNQITKVSNNMINSLIEIDEDKEDKQENDKTDEKQEKKQLDIYYKIKKVIPILDKTGRLYTDISTYLNYLIQNNKLDKFNQKIFAPTSIEKNPLLKPYTINEQRQAKEEFLSHLTDREKRTINYIQPMNKFDQNLNHQIPIIDTPLTIHKTSNAGTSQYINVYFRTLVNPLSIRRTAQNGEEANERTEENESEESSNDHIANNINNFNLNNINTNDEGSTQNNGNTTNNHSNIPNNTSTNPNNNVNSNVNTNAQSQNNQGQNIIDENAENESDLLGKKRKFEKTKLSQNQESKESNQNVDSNETNMNINDTKQVNEGDNNNKVENSTKNTEQTQEDIKNDNSK